jgi:hypothetical protein
MQLLRHIILLCFLATTLNGWSQAIKKENPIVFAEGFFGGAWGNTGGFAAGVNLNYQLHRSLFSFRYCENVKFNSYVNTIGLIALPTLTLYSDMEEASILYGWRFIQNAHSLSFSLGVSYSNLSYRPKNDYQAEYSTANYIGLPYEFNIKWFKPVKKRYGIFYGLIPVGRPVSFGHSFGLKIYGNISRYSYVGFGISYGLGWHKEY